MENFFTQFNKDMDSEFLSTVSEIEALNKERKFCDVPNGTYIVELDNMEVTKSKKGNMMIRVAYKVITDKDGKKQYTNCIVFQYVMLSNVNRSNDFLKSLESGQPIKFTDLEQYKTLVSDVLTCVKGWKQYELSISEYNGFRNFKIMKVMDKEMEELPFAD